MRGERRRTAMSVAAIPVLAAVLLAGCGGGDGDGEAAGDRVDDVTTTTFDVGDTETTDTTVGTDTSLTTLPGDTGTTLPGGTPTTAGSPGSTSGPRRTTTTARRNTATTGRQTTTTARPQTVTDEGPPKNIVGASVAPGAPIKLGILGGEPNEFNGNVERMYEIALESLRRKGDLPVHGRDIVPYWRGWQFLDATNAARNARAACTASAQDDNVFAALVWAASPECLAGDFKIPTFGGGITDEAMKQTFPYAFTTAQSLNDTLANAPHWAHDRGLLKGATIGIYHGTARTRLVNDFFTPHLRRAGYSLKEDVAGDDAAADRVAVQRFKAAGVDTIFLTSARPGEFSVAATAQSYHPKYLLAAPEAAVICDGCPARVGMTKANFDGSFAMSGGRVGENGVGGNPPPHPKGVECAQNYEKFSGERVRQTGTPSEQQRWQSVQWSCIQTEVLVNALKIAGPNLTQGALINAYETATKGVESGFFADITFTRTKHYGSNQVRTLQFDGDCVCWKVRSPLRPLYVDA